MSRLAQAAALFDRFVLSDWASCHVRAAGLDLFVARRAGVADPLAAPPPAVAAATPWLAPHLGTLLRLAPMGTAVAMGEVFGALDLLDEEVPLRAAADGRIVAHHAAIGTLVEFDQPLVGVA